jgi:hypothetical protein
VADAANATRIFGNITHWNVGEVTTMANLFFGIVRFNELLDWDCARVVDMSAMLRGATQFDQPLDFDASSVTTMFRLFNNANAFNQPLIFDTGSVIDMSQMCARCPGRASSPGVRTKPPWQVSKRQRLQQQRELGRLARGGHVLHVLPGRRLQPAALPHHQCPASEHLGYVPRRRRELHVSGVLPHAHARSRALSRMQA